jgi:hypothetical protein
MTSATAATPIHCDYFIRQCTDAQRFCKIWRFTGGFLDATIYVLTLSYRKNRSMRRLLILLLFLPFLACHKSQSAVTGTLEPGIGCGVFVIQISSTSYMQPLNLGSFPNVTQKAGQKVAFTYKVDEDVATACMQGPAINLITIRND